MHMRHIFLFFVSGDAFLHLGEVPSVQVSPHHWRVSDSHREDSIFGTPINTSRQRYIGFSGGIQWLADKVLMDQRLGTRQIFTGLDQCRI